MPTARERMLTLSSLPAGQGYTARQHFLSITQTGGGETIYLYPEHSLTFEQQDSTVEFMENAYIVSYDEQYDIDIQVYDDEDGITLESGDTITHVT